MGNALTDIMDEVAQLKKPAAQAPVEEVPVQPASSAAPLVQDPGPPRFLGIDLEHNVLISSMGNVLINEKEAKEIIHICLRTLARSLRSTFALAAKNHGIDPPKRTGLTVMETELEPKSEGSMPVLPSN